MLSEFKDLEKEEVFWALSKNVYCFVGLPDV